MKFKTQIDKCTLHAARRHPRASFALREARYRMVLGKDTGIYAF